MRFSTRLLSSILLGSTFLLSPIANLVRADVPATPEQAPATTPAAPATEQPGSESPVKEATPATPTAPVTTTVIVPAPTAAPASATAADFVETPDELRFVELVNVERKKRGLSQLTVEPLLIKVARDHSREMQDKAYFNHNSPTTTLKTPMDRYLKAAYARPEYACVGENLFYCSIVDVQRGHNAFMNSPTHRDNVLFPRYEKIGVGIVKNERGEFWVTQMYLTNTDPNVYAKHMAKK